MGKKIQTAQNRPMSEQRSIIGEKLSFAGAEAYKQLRTNISFSLPADKLNKIIAVTSATVGDGKSVTSINLAYALAATGDKVVLVEGDMRLPFMNQRLQLKSAPGLSDILVGKIDIVNALQTVKSNDKFYAITAGSIPPNPSELLASVKMKEVLKILNDTFDYVIVDLPPVNVVTDASSLSHEMDGYIVVVRQNKTTLRSVKDALDRLKLVDGKVLGFVLNDVKLSSHGYYKKYGYGEYSS